MVDAVGDIRNAFNKGAFAPNDEVKEAEFKVYFSDTLPRWVAAIQKRLLKKDAKDRKYIVGDKSPTIADFALTAWAYNAYLNPESPFQARMAEVVDRFPELAAYFKGLGTLPGVKEHLETRFKSAM